MEKRETAGALEAEFVVFGLETVGSKEGNGNENKYEPRVTVISFSVFDNKRLSQLKLIVLKSGLNS